MGKKTVFVFILLLVILAAAFNLPSNYPLKISYKNFHLERTLNPLSIGRKTPKTVLGLDLAGGVHLVYEADMSGIDRADQNDALDSARDIIERRVNFFGATEPVIQTSRVANSKRIIVELPGVTQTEEAKALIGKTAQLDFRQIKEATDSAFFPTVANTESTNLTGKNLKKAAVVFNQNTGKPEVSLSFDREGGEIFTKITEANLGKPLPIFIDNLLVTAPTVNSVITGGSAVITGSFTEEEAKNLSIQLNSGALPVPIKIIEERIIGATLGAESVKKSVFAGLFGLGMVMLFMWFYYGRLGLVADAALVVYALVSLAIFRLIPITLTLPAIAGFILSIGMAVDANILIFERIKEELRDGQNWQNAMEEGFGRAWDSIRDANLTTLLTTFILFNPLNWSFLPQFGLIRGFAATLAIGVLVGLFTGIVVSRNLIRLTIKQQKNA